MRHTHVAPAPLVASLSARAAVRATKVSRCGAKARGAAVLRVTRSPAVAAAVVPSETLTNTVPVPVNGDAAHVTCGASPLPVSLRPSRRPR